MKRISINILIIIFFLCSYHLCLVADEVITEEYIVNILDGEDKPSSYAPFNKDETLLNKNYGVSCNINFDYDSAQINEDSYNILIPIGRSLESEVLKKFNFMIVVYTDSTATEEYKITLPLKMAENVKKFLTTNFSISNERLMVKVMEGATRCQIFIIDK